MRPSGLTLYSVSEPEGPLHPSPGSGADAPLSFTRKEAQSRFKGDDSHPDPLLRNRLCASRREARWDVTDY